MGLGSSEPLHVLSADGSRIGFDRFGAGPPLVLVHGGTADRTRWAPVAPALATKFTVHAVDRRGRGLSRAEAGVYAIEREAEDIAAVVEFAGDDVLLVAHSYGAICSLEAARRTVAVGRMVLYEPPIPTPQHDVFPPGALDRLRAAGASADPERILEVFFAEIIELPAAAIQAMKATAMWRARLDAAQTLVREADALQAYRLPADLSSIRCPVRLLVGTESPHYYRPAAEAVAGLIPAAEIVDLVGQAHLAIDHDPEQFVGAVLTFAGG